MDRCFLSVLIAIFFALRMMSYIFTLNTVSSHFVDRNFGIYFCTDDINTMKTAFKMV